MLYPLFYTGLPAVRESGNSPGIWVWFFPALERSGNYVISPKVREKSGNSTIHLFYYIILHLCAYFQKKIRIFRAVNPTKTFFVKKNNSCRVSPSHNLYHVLIEATRGMQKALTPENHFMGSLCFCFERTSE